MTTLRNPGDNDDDDIHDDNEDDGDEDDTDNTPMCVYATAALKYEDLRSSAV